MEAGTIEARKCDICKREVLYYPDDSHYGSDVWDIDGLLICEDCIRDYVDQTYKREMTVND